MTITFPVNDLIEFCGWSPEGYSFALNRQDVHSRSRSGRIWSRELVSPLWMASYTSVELDFVRLRKLKAKVDSVSRVSGSFIARDVSRLYPASRPFGDFDDTGTILGINANGNGISIAGMPSFQFSAGDLFSYVWNGVEVMHELSETFNANSSGNTNVSEIDPPLWPGVEINTALKFKRPGCRMKIVPGSVNAPFPAGVIGQVSFQAYQFPAG